MPKKTTQTAEMARFGQLSEVELGERCAELLASLRLGKRWSRGKFARLLHISPAVLFNLENAKTRITIGLFIRALVAVKRQPAPLFANVIMSVRGETTFAEIFAQDDRAISSGMVKLFRSRQSTSQRNLALRLGYASGAMVHHFEKGLREASLIDILKLMHLAGDNVQLFIRGITGDDKLAALFPKGDSTAPQEWQEYWAAPYIAGMRQLMRTTAWARIPRYKPGYFANLLDITEREERHGLKVLTDLGVVHWENAKPRVLAERRIIVPKNIDPEIITAFKRMWIGFLLKHMGEDDLMSIDLIPSHERIFHETKALIREAQDRLHNMPLTETDGFSCVAWLAGRIRA